MIAELLNISIPGAIVAIAVLTIVFGIITVNVLCKKQKERRRAEELVEDEGEIREPRQVTMKITCDEGFSAEFLRELALYIEERDEDDFNFEFESFRGCAEITLED